MGKRWKRRQVVGLKKGCHVAERNLEFSEGQHGRQECVWWTLNAVCWAHVGQHPPCYANPDHLLRPILVQCSVTIRYGAVPFSTLITAHIWLFV